MESQARHSSILLLCALALFANAAVGQSLSIIKKGKTEYSVEGTAPRDARYVLQMSENLRLWSDVNDDVSGPVSNRVDIAEGSRRFFRLTPWSPPPAPIRMVLLGDSTVGAGIGWGIGINGYFKPEVTIVNLGAANYSSKIFLASEQLPQMVAIKPDFVLVQFGWVDAGGCGGEPDRCGTTLQEFADNVKAIVQIIRGFNGTPILITPPDPKVFDQKGKLLRNVALQERVAVLKVVATQLQTHFIDLNGLSADLLNGLGESASAYLSKSDTDRVHFSPEGAVVFSGLIVSALPKSLAPYLVANATVPPKP